MRSLEFSRPRPKVTFGSGLGRLLSSLASDPKPAAPMRLLAISLGPLLSLLPLTAKPLPVGSARITVSGSEPITAFTYKPSGFVDGPLLLVFHGVNRNAEEYRNHAIGMAEKFGAMVVAPQFDARRFKSERYQRGGVLRKGKPQRQGQWTYAIVHRLVAQVRAMEGRPEMPYYLIGHSAGGQFLARMAAFSPGDASRIVVANPGSYLFPTRDLPYGYGFGNLPPQLNNDAMLRAYLAAPLTLYLGTADTAANANFDDSPSALRQGRSRVERGRACFAMARQLAARKKWAFNWRKVETRGVGHSAAQMFAAKEVESALFGRAAHNRGRIARQPVRSAPPSRQLKRGSLPSPLTMR